VPADLDTRTAGLYAPEGEFLPELDRGRVIPDSDVFAGSRERFEGLISFLGGSESGALEHAELEARLERDARELVRGLLQDHLTVRELREPRLVEVTDTGGVAHRHLEAGHERPLATVFGEVRVRRVAYRARGRRNLCPADAALNLPVERHSHGLRRLAAIEASRGSFEDAAAAIERATGQRLGKRQIELLAQRAAVDFDGFYGQRRPSAADPGDALIISCDGKGVVMRRDALRPVTRRQAARAKTKLQTRLSKGEKRARKRMAEVGAVYDATPVPRTTADILPATDADRDTVTTGPTAKHKRLTASVVNDAATVVSQLFDEAERRDPDHTRPWVALVDGNNHQINRIQAEATARGVTVTTVIDFVHVLEYLWKAAWSFHAEGDPAAEAWVRRHAERILDGRATKVAGALRRAATKAGLDPTQRAGADACATYLTNKRAHLDYPTALQRGWPIATGVIEGACRHLVKDRMDLTGARWGLTGAEAILKLRALRANNDFDEYWRYHLTRERSSIHESRYADNKIPCPA